MKFPLTILVVSCLSVQGAGLVNGVLSPVPGTGGSGSGATNALGSISGPNITQGALTLNANGSSNLAITITGTLGNNTTGSAATVTANIGSNVLYLDITNGNDANTGFGPYNALKTPQAVSGKNLNGFTVHVYPGNYDFTTNGTDSSWTISNTVVVVESGATLYDDATATNSSAAQGSGCVLFLTGNALVTGGGTIETLATNNVAYPILSSLSPDPAANNFVQTVKGMNLIGLSDVWDELSTDVTSNSFEIDFEQNHVIGLWDGFVWNGTVGTNFSTNQVFNWNGNNILIQNSLTNYNVTNGPILGQVERCFVPSFGTWNINNNIIRLLNTNSTGTFIYQSTATHNKRPTFNIGPQILISTNLNSTATLFSPGVNQTTKINLFGWNYDVGLLSGNLATTYTFTGMTNVIFSDVASMPTNTAPVRTVTPSGLDTIALNKGWTNDLVQRADLVIDLWQTSLSTNYFTFTNTATGECHTNLIISLAAQTNITTIVYPEISTNEFGTISNYLTAGSTAPTITAHWKAK